MWHADLSQSLTLSHWKLNESWFLKGIHCKVYDFLIIWKVIKERGVLGISWYKLGIKGYGLGIWGYGLGIWGCELGIRG